MVIRPTDPEHSRRLSAPGPEAAAAQAAKQRQQKPGDAVPPAPVAAPADRTEVSSAARELLEQLGSTAPPSAALSPERAHKVLDRIRTGHYDRPEVLDQVARKVQADETESGTGD